MKILVTNDDGYQAQGLQVLVKILRKYGDLTVVAPKTHQSGMSMAVSMGLRPIAIKHLEGKPGEDWWYVDGTPASCVKYGIDNVMAECRPDIVFSGINHGSNAATAALYSGTLGAAMEAAVNRVPGIGISIDDMRYETDFSALEELLPPLLDKLLPNLSGKYGQFYNINFPILPAKDIKGIKIGYMGRGHWEREYQPYSLDFFEKFGLPVTRFHTEAVANAEPGEEMYVMVGDFTDEQENTELSDHHIVADGFISITAHNIDNTDYEEMERLCDIMS